MNKHFDMIKRLYEYYKYMPLFLWYRLTARGWTPSEDIYSKSESGFGYLYWRFWFHHELVSGAKRSMNSEDLDGSSLFVGNYIEVAYVGNYIPERLFTPKEMNDTSVGNYENPGVFKKDEEVK